MLAVVRVGAGVRQLTESHGRSTKAREVRWCWTGWVVFTR
jgi:hypothetical protein